jgi:hypothetical protein
MRRRASASGELAGWFLDLVEDLPPVSLEGLLVGLGDLGDGISEAMDDAALTERLREDLLDRGDQSWRAVGDDEER